MPRVGGTISLAPNACAIAHLITRSLTAWLQSSNPGLLVRLTFLDEMVFPEGFSPSTSAFEARRSIH